MRYDRARARTPRCRRGPIPRPEPPGADN